MSALSEIAMSEKRFWTKGRLARICVCLLIGFFLALFIAHYADRTKTTSITRGDFPAFYAAAVLAKYDAKNLYDASAQQKIENHYWPSLSGSYYFFSYPPYVAVILSPLAKLNAHQAKAVYFAIMFVALIASTYLVSSPQLNFTRAPFVTFTVFLFFGPVLSGLAAGQNITLSMLCYVGFLYFWSLDSKRGSILAGLCLGLWMFKPHFALLPLFFSLLSRRRASIALGAMIPAIFYYALAASLSGFYWPVSWLNAVSDFAAKDYIANRHQMVSLFSIIDIFVTSIGFESDFHSFLKILSAVMALLLVALVGKLVLRANGLEAGRERSEREMDIACLLGPAVVILSPHVLYYDLGLCLIPLSRSVDLRDDRNINLLILLWALMLTLSMTREFFSIQPMFLFGLGSFIFLCKRAYRKRFNS
ncbi:MAG: DUF2029 domain-containing protein [Deltaproteobacteria bacterium]|nr:DUF2029 domain-containing protein [Deltaproteobacteria bacterium]